MELIEDDPGYIEPVLAIGIRRKHLVKAVRRVVDDPLLGCQDLDPLAERRTHAHHVRCHVEHDRNLLPIGRAAIHLGAFLPVPAAK